MKVEIKKKRKLSWWWSLLLFLPLGLLLFIAFGPNPKIELGKETTFITEPLLDNGVPDYSEYVIQRSKAGVTADNNAAVPLCQALWPCDLSKEDQKTILEALDIPPPDPAQVLVSAHDTAPEIKQWILKIVPDAYEPALDSDFTFDVIEPAMSSTWEPGQLPTIDAWAKRNRLPLELLRQGSARPKYFALLPLDAEQYTGFFFSDFDVQAARNAALNLSVSAMWNLSHGRHVECWQDLLACYRIARHASQGFSAVPNLVAMSMEEMAQNSFHQLVHDRELPNELLEQIKFDLTSLAPRKTVSQVIDDQRLEALALALHPKVDPTGFVRVDWNVVLRKLNGLLDEYAEIAKLPYLDRQERLDRLSLEIDTRESANSSGRFAGSIFDLHTRSEWLMESMYEFLLPPTRRFLARNDQALANERLTRISIALAEYRLKHGEYPDLLDQLVPEILTSVPLDYYTETQPIYRKKSDGFVLYSRFENKQDDGGTDSYGQIVNGEHHSTQAGNYREAADLVIRIPKPKFSMPPIVLNEDAAEWELNRKNNPYGGDE